MVQQNNFKFYNTNLHGYYKYLISNENDKNTKEHTKNISQGLISASILFVVILILLTSYHTGNLMIVKLNENFYCVKQISENELPVNYQFITSGCNVTNLTHISPLDLDLCDHCEKSMCTIHIIPSINKFLIGLLINCCTFVCIFILAVVSYFSIIGVYNICVIFKNFISSLSLVWIEYLSFRLKLKENMSDIIYQPKLDDKFHTGESYLNYVYGFYIFISSHANNKNIINDFIMFGDILLFICFIHMTNLFGYFLNSIINNKDYEIELISIYGKYFYIVLYACNVLCGISGYVIILYICLLCTVLCVMLYYCYETIQQCTISINKTWNDYLTYRNK